MIKNIKIRRDVFILVFFVLLKLILQLILINPCYELHRDEFLYLDQANHLAWGYHSVPPFTAFTSFLIQLLGGTTFWIKLFPALWGAFTIIFAWGIVDELNGKLFAKVLTATAITFSAILRINTLYQPNSFDILSWTAVFFFTIKYVNSSNGKYLAAAAIALAIGFLNKYNVLFLVAGLVPSIIIFRPGITKEKWMYVSICLFSILILPNIIWQVNNGFPVVNHMKTLAATQLVNVSRITFLTDQLLFIFNSVALIIAAFVGVIFSKNLKTHRYLAIAVVLTLAIFTLLKAKNYYAIGIYPMLLAVGATYIEEFNGKWWKRVVRPAIFILILILFIPTIKIIYPTLTPSEINNHAETFRKFGLLRWEDGKEHAIPQDFADMLGWKELANKIDSVYQQKIKEGNIFILCDNYGQAGAINFYSKNKGVIANSFSDDYIGWVSMGYPICNVILIKGPYDEDPSRTKERKIFEEVVKVGEITAPFAREQGTSIYYLKGALININALIQEEIAERKNK